MSRERYGDWATSAGDADLASALAAAGVAASGGELTPMAFLRQALAPGRDHYIWTDPVDIGDGETAATPTVAEWAAAWRRVPFEERPALALQLDPSDPATLWTVETLTRCADPYLPFESIRVAEPWRVPIRIGVLDDEDGRRLLGDLLRSFEGHPWRSELIEPVVVGRERIACDILALPGSVASTQATIDRTREVRAGALLVSGADGPWATLARQVGAWSIGVLPAPPTAAGIVEICRELSHDKPFDGAVRAASPAPAMIIADARSIGSGTIARRARDTAAILRGIAADGDRLAGGACSAISGFNDGPEELAAHFEFAADWGLFESEGGEATDLLDLERRAAPLIRDSVGRRRLHARITDQDGTAMPLRRFRPATRHRIDVFIGSGRQDWLGARAAFPDEPGTGGRRPLLIVLTENDLLAVPQVQQVELPPTGDSDAVTFELTTLPDTTSVDARLIVLSGNRVLQAARLPTEVGPAETSFESPVRPEATVSPTTAELHERRSFDAALMAGHGPEGETTLTAVADGNAATIRFTGDAVDTASSRIRGRLAEVIMSDQQVGSLADPAAVELLIFLAYHGFLLRQAIERDAANLNASLRGSTYLQIVSAEAEAFLPLELAYDFAMPDVNARLCPHAVEALGVDDPASGCPGPHHADVVCPFGFWGITKVIERQAFRPGVPAADQFQLRGSPARDRNRIPLGPILFAASDRVDGFAGGSVDLLAATLRRLSPTVWQVATWEDWPPAVARHHPAVLMVLPHTVYSDRYDGYGLEIGANARLWKITSDLLPDRRPAIVALLGCETACAGRISYENFPSLLRGAGAEVVIATLTEVLGRYAAPVAASLVEEIYQACRRKPHGLGEVMLALRRRLLAEGNLTVLALAAFGDADWLITTDGTPC
ncbi:hypothetical protein Q0Z83_023030 [Actinoplanes sichuanensis]|uniref:CHAT domain-containing protein n=1 Tax=Actinoplanes sichuanensis TaxID=512349 RepID=A0ABW4A1B9_9ACTN|nr:hypothetical protein [Actinoplanes sichuanensis]BEL04112.1 hypothetical protein Q0Z83_023030 [Actinoplanes sichuanensis]